MMLRLRYFAPIVVGFVLLACNSAQETPENVPITHSSAALTVQQDTEHALRGLVGSSEHMTQSKSLANLLSQFGGSSSDCSSSTTKPVCTAGTTNCGDPVTTVECTSSKNEVTEADLVEARDDANESIDDFVSVLRDKVFVDANLESDDGKIVVYRIGKEALCSEMPTVSSPGILNPDGSITPGPASTTTTSTPNYDPECVADLEKWVPRLQLSSTKSGTVDVALQLTDQRYSPLAVSLSETEVGVRVDLGAIKAAADRAGQPMEGVSELAGVFQGKLVQNEARVVQLEASVVEAFRAVVGDRPEKQFTVTVAPSQKTAALAMDGNSGSIQGSLNVGSVGLSAPLAAFMGEDSEDYATVPVGTNTPSTPTTPAEPKEYHGNIEAFLSGMKGNIAYELSSDSLALSGVSFGSQPSYVKHDGTTILSIDVNANAGHTFDLKIDSNDAGPNLQFSPELTVEALLGFAKIADQVTDLKQFMLNDRMKLSLSGDKPTIRLESEQLRVVSGTLEISSEVTPSYRHLVATAMCLVDADPEQTPPSMVGMFATATCQ